MKKHLLSVVVPAYKQEKTIKQNLLRIKKVLDNAPVDYEIICVVDGETDQTFKNAKSIKNPKIKAIGYAQNRGKGHAVRFGMKEAKGDIVAFIDAGLELNPEVLLMGLQHYFWYDADIIVGSKRHPASKVDYPLQRRILSFGYQWLVRILFDLKIRDTQLGMKIFRREVIEKTLSKMTVDRYAFDIEMLAVANHLGFNRIYESPVSINYDFEDLTHASALKSISKMFWDTLGVFYKLRIQRVYDK